MTVETGEILIRPKDPNNHSDTETGTLSRYPDPFPCHSAVCLQLADPTLPSSDDVFYAQPLISQLNLWS